MRHQGFDESTVHFRVALQNLRAGQVRLDDWALLGTRVKAVLPQWDVDRFAGTLRIYAKKDQVGTFNRQALKDLGVPVLAVKASHSDSTAAKPLQNEVPIW